MYIYAQLNEDTVVIGISQLSGEVITDNMVLINDLEVELGSTYNRTTGEFTPPEPQPMSEPTPSTEQMQAQALLNTELLLIYKELEMEGI